MRQVGPVFSLKILNSGLPYGFAWLITIFECGIRGNYFKGEFQLYLNNRYGKKKTCNKNK